MGEDTMCKELEHWHIECHIGLSGGDRLHTACFKPEIFMEIEQ